jgi:phage-related protein (TIGR01555 family)
MHPVVTKITQLASVVGRKMDGWSNVLTGLGVAGKDKRLGLKFGWSAMSELEAEHLYATSDVARRVVDYVPDEGTRKWIEIKNGQAGADDPQAKDACLYLDDLKTKANFCKAWKWARQYGGAGILMVVDDGLMLDEPMDLTRVRSIKSLVVLNRWELIAWELVSDLESPEFGEASVYELAPANSTDTRLYSQKVHRSRIIRFDGAPLSRRLWEVNGRWHDSILNKMLNAIRNYEGAHDSVAAAIQDFRLVVLKLKYLADMVGSDDSKKLMDRVNLMNTTKSILNAICIDAENESLDHVGTDFANIEKVLGKVEDRLVTSTDLPHTVVLGEGAQGTLGGGGESEDDNVKELVTGQQELVLAPALDRLFEVMMAAKDGPTNGKDVEDLSYSFRPLWQESESEKAMTHKTQAEADAIYIDRGVVSPQTIASSRFGGSEYSSETAMEETFAKGTETAGTPPPKPIVMTDPNAMPPKGDNADGHGHSIWMDGMGMGYTSGPNGEDANHTHTMPNGVETGAPIELFGGGHHHQTHSDHFSSPSMPMSSIKEMQAMMAERKAEKVK